MELLLKILEGPQKGAELPLTEGTWQFGTDLENDLVLDDDQVEDKHFSIAIEGETEIKLTRLNEARVYLDDELVSEETVGVAYFQKLRVGETLLALGPKDGQWPALEEVVAEDHREEAPAKGRRFMVPTLALTLLIVLGFTYWTQKTRVEETAGAQIEKIDVLAIAAEAGVEHPQLDEDGEGNRILRGMVMYADQEHRLRDQLDGHARPELVVIERVLASARDIVAAYQPGARVSLGEGQQIRISGACANDARVARLSRVLAEDLPQSVPVENLLRTPSTLYPPLREMLVETGLQKMISFSIEEGLLVVRGTPPSKRLKDWQEARDAFAEKWGVSIVEHFNQTPKQSPKAPHKLDIHGVSIGTVSYITLEGGAKYFEGATLENGAVITHIAADHIVLRQAGRSTKYKLGG